MATDTMRAAFEVWLYGPHPEGWSAGLLDSAEINIAWHGWKAATARLEAELREAQQDAERYRFLRKGFGDFGPEVDMHNAFVDGGEKMDAAIDAARQPSSDTQGGE